MLEQIVIGGTVEILKHIIKGFFRDERDKIGINEVLRSIAKLERAIDHKFDDLTEQIQKEVFRAIEQVPLFQIMEENIILNPDIKNRRSNSYLEHEVSSTLHKIIKRRKNEILKDSSKDEEKTGLKLKSKTNEPSISSEWDIEMKTALNNIKNRRLNLE